MSKTIYASARELKARGIDLSGYPSAGPNPSISGMKKMVWGIDAYVVKSGSYIYKVPGDLYRRIRGY